VKKNKKKKEKKKKNNARAPSMADEQRLRREKKNEIKFLTISASMQGKVGVGESFANARRAQTRKVTLDDHTVPR